jgi:outer membrane receptor for ferrienterochelin and colicins
VRQWRACLGPALTFVLLTVARPAFAQTATIHGSVVNSATGAPIRGVLVTSIDVTNRVADTATTDSLGRFRLHGLAQAPYRLVLSRAGYAARTLFAVVPNESTDLAIVLSPSGIRLDAILVTASKMPELMRDAPASTSIVERWRIEQEIALTPLDHVRTLPGVDFAQKGLVQDVYAVRGLRPVANAALLTLVDGRRSALPVGSANRSYLLSPVDDDIERIELVRGPGAALYGPGAQRGVLQIITRSPFESPGATFTLAAGERQLRQTTARFARVLSPNVAIKASGSWLQGHDWEFRDSTEDAMRQKRIASGANPDTLLTGLRDFNMRRATADLRLDWRPDSVTTITSSVGGAEAFSLIDATGDVSATQLRDVRYEFAQAKVQRRRLFANLTYNLHDAGTSYALRTGAPMIGSSRQAAAQLQNGWGAGHIDVLYGLDGRWTEPGTETEVNEVGSYAQARASVSPRLDLLSVARLDHNDRMNDLAFSPRAAVIFKPAPGHALRLTYNRAFTSPEGGQLFLDTPVPGFAFPVREVAVPQSGFSFRRDCGGLCMRSQYNPAGSGQYLPADATLVWDSVVAKLARGGKDISAIPRPGTAQVGTRLARLTGAPLAWQTVTASDIVDLGGRRRTIYETLELGYKGRLDRPVVFSLDFYSGRVKDPIGANVYITRGVYYDSTTLARYLSGFRPADEAARLAGMIDTIRVGAVSPQQARDPLEILRARLQGGAYAIWGSDLALTAALSPYLDLEGSYSWINRNLFPDVDPNDPTGGDLTLVAPRTKGSAALRYHSDRRGLVATVEGRALGSFIQSTNTNEVVGGYRAFDASVSCQLPWTTGVTLSVKGSNLLNNMHREISGGQPMIGRLVVARVRVTM